MVSGENQLKEFSDFLHDHQSILSDVLSKNQFITTTNEMISDESCPALMMAEKDVLRLHQHLSIEFDFAYSPEHIPTMDLIHSANKSLNKTIAVFVQLCVEARNLCNEGNQLLTDCLFSNEELCDIFRSNSELSSTEMFISDKIPLSSKSLSTIWSKLKLFFEVQQFTDRCFNLISDIINQFTALFSVNNYNYINVDYSSLHFQV